MARQELEIKLINKLTFLVKNIFQILIFCFKTTVAYKLHISIKLCNCEGTKYGILPPNLNEN